LADAFAFCASKLHEVPKCVTQGMAMSGLVCFEGVSLTAWNKLPDNLKSKLPEAQALAAAALLKAFKEDDEKWIPIFKQKLEVVQFPAKERAKLAAAANDIWEDWVKAQEAAGRPGREMLDFVKAQVAKYK